jgi:sterol desaturase/sphingolipid hydroxylase (fatty acid hydroxylase superfamily)
MLFLASTAPTLAVPLLALPIALPPLSEPMLRFGAFAGVFVVMALLELAIPKRDLGAPKIRRWATNLSMVGLGIATTRLMGLVAQPLVAVGAALVAEANGWGLFNLLALPGWVEIVAAIVILDFAVWFQHYASHVVPVLWRFHRMHHADTDIDLTTGLRFHPIEIGMSMLYKVGWVFVLGPAPVAVVLFEVILNAGAVFNHANVDLPPWLDRALRLVIVTPDMHRVHHSIVTREHDTNFGFNLAIWDRLFGTYTDQPAGGHRGMRIGLSDYQEPGPTRLGWSLLLPFRRR